MANLLESNLNLLVAFDALLAERNVTMAARRIGLSQPAMSNVLAQLRLLFRDPLFVRTSQGMEPTPRALDLATPVRQGIAAFSVALAEPADFDPTTSRETFVIALSDLVELALLPRLVRYLSKQAPGIDLQVVPWGLHKVPSELETGYLDLMIGFYSSNKLAAGHFEQPLLQCSFTCIARKNHPKIRRYLTLKTYLEASHIVVTEEPRGLGLADKVLTKMGKRRRVAARVPRFFMVPQLVAETDMIATAESRVAQYYADSLPIRLFPPPIRVPGGTVGMVWHGRTDADPARRWLRRVISKLSKDT